jgi:hypothetical protein
MKFYKKKLIFKVMKEKTHSLFGNDLSVNLGKKK